MKKNFLKIAAMLIAAMLLVVSCSQEVAPKNDGLVSASINIADTRSLSTKGEDFGSITYEYQLHHKFDQIGTNSVIVGDVNEWTSIPGDNTLGYVTQGLWEILVRGNDSNGNVVLSGKADHYFNNKNEVAYVFVDPLNENGGSISIDVQMQDLDESSSNYYSVKYKLVSLAGETVSEDTLKRESVNTGTLKNLSKYTTSSNVIAAAGYYRLTISVSDSSDTVLGGITKSIRVLEGREVEVTGSIEPKEFDQSIISVINIKPEGSLDYTKTSLTNGTGIQMVFTVTPDNGLATTLENAGYSLTDDIDKATGKVYSIEYAWDVDGSSVTGKNSTTTVNYTVPGPKSVSCSIIVKVKSFGEIYTYMSADNKSLVKNFVVGTDFSVTVR